MKLVGQDASLVSLFTVPLVFNAFTAHVDTVPASVWTLHNSSVNSHADRII